MRTLFNRTNFASNFFNLIVVLYFIFINSLFFYKYGSRHPSFSIWFLTAYILIQIGVVFFIKFNSIHFKEVYLRNSYFIVCILIALTIFSITYLTDGNSLNVDRWSAMNVAIKAIFSNEYPYTAVDHLGGRTSNFPGLILIGIPFYLLGNVGYLQVFSFSLLSFTLYKCFDIRKALSCILLFSISICFWYEVAVISDFMSNMIIVISAILLWNFYFSNDLFRKPILLGILFSILVLTRGIAFVPIALFLFASFWRTSMSNKIKFAVSGLLTVSLLVFLVVKDCPDLETLKNYNPFLLQTSYTASYINLLAILLPLLLSFYIRNIYHSLFYYSFIILLAIVLSSVVVFYGRFGISEMIHNNKYDLVYLSYLLPIAIIIILRDKGLVNSRFRSEQGLKS